MANENKDYTLVIYELNLGSLRTSKHEILLLGDHLDCSLHLNLTDCNIFLNYNL